jgi:hypothetical protein
VNSVFVNSFGVYTPPGVDQGSELGGSGQAGASIGVCFHESGRFLSSTTVLCCWNLLYEFCRCKCNGRTALGLRAGGQWGLSRSVYQLTFSFL